MKMFRQIIAARYALLRQVAMSVKGMRINSLTGIFNRRAFEKETSQYCSIRQLDTPCYIVLIDLDYFKRVNDRIGHGLGDEVLKKFAQLIHDTLPAGSVIARWGGEEFIAAVKTDQPSDAVEIGQSLINKMEGMSSAGWPSDLRVSASIGVAPLGDGKSLQAVIADADHALYHAKNDGRSCVRMARTKEDPNGKFAAQA